MLKDKDSKIKIEVCGIFAELSEVVEVIDGKNIILGLERAALHRRYKVRFAAIKALKRVLIRKDCQDFFELVVDTFKTLALDKNKVNQIYFNSIFFYILETKILVNLRSK